jgi:hypothetical protein
MAKGDAETQLAAEKCMVVELLKAQFGNASLDFKTGLITATIPSNQVVIDWEADKVTCTPADAPLLARVTTCLERFRAALERISPLDGSLASTLSAV